MKKFFLTSVAVLALCGTSHAGLLLYEGFQYANGSELSTANPAWVQNAPVTNDFVNIGSANLSVQGLAPSTGGSVNFAGQGTDYIRSYGSTPTTIYHSMAFQVNSLTNFSQSGYFAALISSTSTTTVRDTFWIVPNLLTGGATDTTSFDVAFGAATNTPGSSANTPTFDVNLQLNTTYFIVASYNTATNQASVWINPSSSSFGGSAPTPDASGLNAGSVTATGLDGFYIRQDSAGKTPGITLDEIRVGTSWADVTPVPEPAAGGLIVGGLMALIGLVRVCRRGTASARA